MPLLYDDCTELLFLEPKKQRIHNINLFEYYRHLFFVVEMEAYKEKLFALCDTIDEKLENIGIASPSLRLIPPRGLPEDQGEGQRPSLLHHPWSRCSPLPLQHYQPRCWFVCVSRVFSCFPSL